jgi:hypothetical protein
MTLAAPCMPEHHWIRWGEVRRTEAHGWMAVRSSILIFTKPPSKGRSRMPAMPSVTLLRKRRRESLGQRSGRSSLVR